MFLVRAVYTSTAIPNLGLSAVESILEKARGKNLENNVTGMLLFSGDYFLQYIEGGRNQVNETLVRILRDDRHSKPVIIDYSEIEHRSFQDWSMSFVPQSSLTKDLLLKYASEPLFQPYKMPKSSVLELISALGERLKLG